MTLKVLKEIKYYQKTTTLLIPKLAFSRLVREIISEHTGANMNIRITTNALNALQEATEMYMVRFLQDANLCAAHCKRVTLKQNDFHLLRLLKDENYGFIRRI